MNGEAEGTDETDFDSNANLYSLQSVSEGNTLRYIFKCTKSTKFPFRNIEYFLGKSTMSLALKSCLSSKTLWVYPTERPLVTTTAYSTIATHSWAPLRSGAMTCRRGQSVSDLPNKRYQTRFTYYAVSDKMQLS